MWKEDNSVILWRADVFSRDVKCADGNWCYIVIRTGISFTRNEHNNNFLNTLINPFSSTGW